MKRLLRRIRGPSPKEIGETIEWMLKKGLLEWVGLDHGDRILKTTEKGLKFLEEYKRR